MQYILGLVISLAIWVFIIAPIVLEIPKDQTWLEKEYRNSGIRIFVFWPYYLIRNYLRNS